MKMNKKLRKLYKGMNAVTRKHFDEGFKPVTYAGKDGVNIGGVKIPPFSKIKKGTPYVNPLNFGE
jgi:hypothetical protein